ncbi:MAG: hypothetical protein V5B30_12710 [Candidatus Accumulibacter delftensis]
MNKNTKRGKVMSKFVIGATCACLAAVSFNTSAALIDRGSGLLYDDILNITWLQDANYAKSSGYSAEGKLSESTSRDWVGRLVYHDSVRNVDYDDWRLAGSTSTEAPFHYGWWVSTVNYIPTAGPHTELSYMYYENLGLEGYHDTSGRWGTSFGVHGDSAFGGQNDVGLVINLQGGEYWVGDEFGISLAGTNNWTLSMNTGNHYANRDSYLLYAWAVRDGDVAVSAVPIPATIWLFSSGLIGLIGFARRKTQY